jgi:hypothetical protein
VRIDRLLGLITGIESPLQRQSSRFSANFPGFFREKRFRKAERRPFAEADHLRMASASVKGFREIAPRTWANLAR